MDSSPTIIAFPFSSTVWDTCSNGFTPINLKSLTVILSPLALSYPIVSWTTDSKEAINSSLFCTSLRTEESNVTAAVIRLTFV